jgi:hypothetical protein
LDDGRVRAEAVGSRPPPVLRQSAFGQLALEDKPSGRISGLEGHRADTPEALPPNRWKGL